MPEKLLTVPEVTARTGLCRSTLWKLERDGAFPARRRLTASRIAWLESEIDEWLRSRPTVATPRATTAA